MNYNNFVLNNYTTTHCNNGFSNYRNMDLFALLLNNYDEEFIGKFLLNKKMKILMFILER